LPQLRVSLLDVLVADDCVYKDSDGGNDCSIQEVAVAFTVDDGSGGDGRVLVMVGCW
jgi:hypothetical protein